MANDLPSKTRVHILRSRTPIAFITSSMFNAARVICLLLVLPNIVFSQDSILGMDRPGLGLKTLGGRVHWTDQLIWSGWRIQRNTEDGRYRLLSSNDGRMAVGSFDYCVNELRKRRCSGEIPAGQAKVVILLHGLGGTRHYMDGLASCLEQHGMEVVSFGYASTQNSIEELASSLECVVRNLEGVHEVSFVAHSMGNILVRQMLYRIQNCSESKPLNLSFGRMVMISPPNQGAHLADSLGQSALIQSIFGPSVNQFAPNGGWPELQSKLCTPWFEFGIIAGGRGDDRGYLPRIPGDDDGLLSIDSHFLEGATDFVQLGGVHQLMPKYKPVHQATVHFLQHGYFPRR